MRNERTSQRLAKVAGRILAFRVEETTAAEMASMDVCVARGVGWNTGFKWRDIRALAASALTQTADKTAIGLYRAIETRRFTVEDFAKAYGVPLSAIRNLVDKKKARSCKESSLTSFGAAKIKKAKRKGQYNRSDFTTRATPKRRQP